MSAADASGAVLASGTAVPASGTAVPASGTAVPASGTAVLVYEDVAKTFGDNVALRGVSLEVQEGEVFGLLGPNGAGKTTLIRVGLDILRPDTGNVSLFGQPLHRDTLDRVAYLPEERGLYKKTSLTDALAYFGQLKGLGRRDAVAAATRWLEKVGLGAVAKQPVETLSKGMSQKAQIAATLMTEPELCILDEPFSGLDPVNIEVVKRLMHERRAAGRTTILSTHMMSQVEALCDRVGVIHDGRRVVYGALEDVRRAYSNPVVRVRLDGPLGEPPDMVERVSKAVAGSVRGTLELHLKEGATSGELLRALLARGIEVRHFEEVLATMEEIFLRAVGATVDVRDAEARNHAAQNDDAEADDARADDARADDARADDALADDALADEARAGAPDEDDRDADDVASEQAS